MNDLWGILVLLTIMVSIMGWWFNVIAYSRTEDLVVLVMVECVIVFIRRLIVVLVMVECVIVFIRRLMRRFMPMRRIWHAVGGLQLRAALIDARLEIWQPYTGPITGPMAVAIIAREQWRDENNITRNRCRRRLRPELDAGGSRPPRHQ
jgi:hypothetical protein